MNERIIQLEQQVKLLMDVILSQQSANTVPLTLDQALVGRGFTKIGNLTGILKGIGDGTYSGIVPLGGAHNYFVAPTSGASPTTQLTFTNGILTA